MPNNNNNGLLTKAFISFITAIFGLMTAFGLAWSGWVSKSCLSVGQLETKIEYIEKAITTIDTRLAKLLSLSTEIREDQIRREAQEPK